MPDQFTGVIRSATQAFFASLIITITPIIEQLGIDEEVSAAAAAVTSLVVAIAVGIYWYALNWVQTSDQVPPLVKTIVDVLMGGRKTPTYTDQ